MQTVLLLCLTALVAVPLALTIRRPALIFEYPAFMAFTFAAFIVPQAISLIRFPGLVLDESVTSVLLMSCLCMAMCLIGYRLAPSRMAIGLASRPIRADRLLHAGVAFIAVGVITTAMLSRIEVQYAQANGGMTGTGTILLFFRQLAYPGFAIALFSALKRPTVPRVLITLAGSYAPLIDVVIGRREHTAMLFLTIVMAFYYERRIRPSRIAIVGVLVFSMLAIPATTEYRRYLGSNQLDRLGQIDLVGNFQRFITDESTLELRNAAAVIEATRETGNYAAGRGYWNQLVFRYVPAQLLGADVKGALMFDAWDALESERTEAGFRFPRGSTLTGMGDSFNQFGWFGCLFFAFMAVLFKGMWRASLSHGALFARLLYVMTFTSGMRAVTHWTLDFLPGFLYFVIFLGAAGFYAAARPSRAGVRGQYPYPRPAPLASGYVVSHGPPRRF